MTWFSAPAPLLPEIIALNGRSLVGKPALICGETVLDWPAFAEATARVANGLISLGIERGQRVVVLMNNSAETLIIHMGILRAGAVSVPLNVLVPDNGLEPMIADAEARAVFACADNAPRLDPLRDSLDGVEHWFVAGSVADQHPGWSDVEDWQACQPAGDPAVALDDEAECNIIYSSGTTGVPKGIVHSHRRRLDSFYDIGLVLRYDRAAVNLCSLGLYSNISWVAFGATLLLGGTVVVLRAFDPRGVLEHIQRHRVTHSAMVPLQFQRILDVADFDDFDIASIKTMMCCGSPLHPDLKKSIMAKFVPGLIELYGLTEGLITTLDPEDAVERPSSVGRPLMGSEIKILDDDDNECPPGEPGEIVGYGRILMAGYNNRDQASEEATWVDERGRRWLRTGDIGQFDAEGFLYLVDRKKDMILSGGQNIYPADIESVMMGHPAVSEVAVIGIDSKRWGETPLAVVVARETVDAGELTAWTNERVGRQQRIAGVEFIDELPRNANSKVLKRELRDAHRNWLNQT